MRIGIGTSIVGGGFIGTSAPATQYLDEVGGTPTAAYSVDKVVSTYTDAVVEVRRTVSAVTVEADVAFDNDTITLDSAVTITSGSSSATTLGEFVAASGYTDVDSLGSAQDAFVATWYDQAGSNDATQTTAANQPKIVNAGALVTENGKVALDFDGLNSSLATPSIDFTNTDEVTLGLVLSWDGPNTNTQLIIELSTSFNTFNNSFGVVTGNDPITSTGDGFYSIAKGSATINANQAAISPTIAPPAQALLFINHDISGDLSSIYGNGLIGTDGTGEKGTGNFGNYPLYIGSRAGSSFYFEGVIQEFIIYNSDKSALRTAIEGNINGRFSIYT